MNILDKIRDFNYFDNYTNSLFLFFLVLFGSWSGHLLPYSFIKHLDNSRLAQFFLTYVIIIFTLDIFSFPDESILTILYNATIILFIYILVSKQSFYFFTASIILVILRFIFYKRLTQYKKLVNDKSSKQKLVELNKQIDMYEIIDNIIIILFLLVSSCGVILYFIKQYKAHRKKSKNIVHFIIKFLLEGSVKQQRNYASFI